MPAASSLVRTRAGRIRFSVVLLAVNVVCAVVAVAAVGTAHERPLRAATAWLITLAAVGGLRFVWNLTYDPARRPGTWEWITRCWTFAAGSLVLLFAGALIVTGWGGTGAVDARDFGMVVTGETRAAVHHLLGDPQEHVQQDGLPEDCDIYELLPMEAWGEVWYADGRVVRVGSAEAPCQPTAQDSAWSVPAGTTTAPLLEN